MEMLVAELWQQTIASYIVILVLDLEKFKDIIFEVKQKTSKSYPFEFSGYKVAINIGVRQIWQLAKLTLYRQILSPQFFP